VMSIGVNNGLDWRFRGQAWLAVAMALYLSVGGVLLDAAAPVIGTAAANGSFRVDSMTVKGNATLFEGVTIETGAVTSAMQLASGARMTLGAGSKGRIFGDHLVLERGQGQMDKLSSFRVEARGLTIQPETGNASGRVELSGANRVQVAAVTGSFRVLNSTGLLVAKLPEGASLAFEPQGVPTLTRISGRLEIKAGHYLLTDETTRVTTEVVGKDVSKNVGQRVEIRGAMDPAAAPASDASQLVREQNLRLLAQAGPAPAAAGSSSSGAGTAGASSGSGAGAGAGAGTGAGAGAGTAAAGTAAGTAAAGGGLLGLGVGTVAVIGGVAAAATVGGLAASGSFSSSTPVSR